MQIYPLDYVISYARKHSPFYQKLYAHLGENPSLEELSLINPADFWQAAADGLVNTGPHLDGHVFKSGGTTGAPKYTLCTAEEWQTACEVAGLYMPMGGLKKGDRVANLFYAGSLYGGFLFAYSCFYSSPASILHFGLSGSMEIAEIVEIIERHRINKIAGLPSIIMKIMKLVENKGIASRLCVDSIYFAGEMLYPEQRRKINEILGEHVDFRSMAYASSDGGMIGYFHKGSCGFNEHRTCDTLCRMELIDPETGEVIREANRPGEIYVTSLFKLLMPVIRYPSGDMGQYTEPEGTPDRKFMLLGRSGAVARVGWVTIHPEDVSRIMDNLGARYDGLQLVITRDGERDGLTIRIASNSEVPGFTAGLYEQYPLLKDTVDKGIVSAPLIEYCSLKNLEYNKRTGKLMRILDKRLPWDTV
jgi:phenylacetate-CoA ligase